VSFPSHDLNFQYHMLWVFFNVKWFEVRGGCLIWSEKWLFDLRWDDSGGCLIWGERWLFYLRWDDSGGCLIWGERWLFDLRWDDSGGCLIWGERWLFDLLIVVELLTITVQLKLSFHNSNYSVNHFLHCVGLLVCNLISW
jgi:hypothetical protein